MSNSNRKRAVVGNICCLLTIFSAVASLADEGERQQYVTYTIGAPGNNSEIAIKGDIGTGAVQPGGTYNYSYPIDVPAGPRGIAPSLAIVYTGEGNGWAGKNWSFGFGSVTRDTREGVPTDLIDIAAGDYLLNGSRLVWQPDTASRYRTEIESHQLILYDEDNNVWRVTEPDGTTHIYGGMAGDGGTAATVPAYGFGGGVIGTREWLLGQTIDTKGNLIRYFYASGSVHYPTKIVWGNSAASSFHAVHFNSVSRSDIRTSFATGSKVVEDQKLKIIEVSFRTNSVGSSGQPLRQYELSYVLGDHSKASRLTRIVERGLDGAVGPERITEFDYAPEDMSLTADPGFMSGLPGEGSDVVLHTTRSRFSCTHGPVLPQGCPGGSGAFDVTVSDGDHKSNIMVADIDNDGIPEIIQGASGPEGMGVPTDNDTPGPRPDEIVGTYYADSRAWRVRDSFNGWDPNNPGLRVPAPFRRWREWADTSEDFGARFLDLDRDGTQDLLVSYKYRNVNEEPVEAERAWFNNGNPKGVNWSNAEEFSFPGSGANKLRLTYFGQDTGVRIADVNGDGFPDLIHAYEGGEALEPGRPLQNISELERPRPPAGQAVYLMNPATGRWRATPSGTYVVPNGVYFIGRAPVDAFRWRAAFGEHDPTTCDGRMALQATLDVDMGTQMLDVNGDGLPDLVKATSYDYDGSNQNCGLSGFGCGQANCPDTWAGQEPTNGVWLNTGRGWKRDDEYSDSLTVDHQVYLHNKDLLCKSNCEMEYSLLDFNDDGLPDLYKRSGPAFYRNTGAGWAQQGTGYLGLDFGEGQQFQDFNGDGRPDYLAKWRSKRFGPWTNLEEHGHTLAFFASDGSHPDLLQMVTNPLGGKLQISYQHSSKWRNDHNALLPQTRYVVTEIVANSAPDNAVVGARDPHHVSGLGTSGTSRTNYQYFKGAFDFGQREFRGFGLVRSIARDGNEPGDLVTETEYLQDDECKNLVSRVVVRTAANGGEIKQVKEYQYALAPPVVSGVYDRRMLLETADDDDNPVTPVQKQVEYEYDEPGDYGTGSEAVGNLLATTEQGRPGAFGDGIAGSKRRTEWTYTPNFGLWLVNYPSSVRTYAVDGAEPLVAETLHAYDQLGPNAAPTTGLLTDTVVKNRYLGVDGPPMITRFGYDAFGNTTSQTDADGHTTVFGYDHGTYLTSITPPTSSLDPAVDRTTRFYYHGVNAAGDPGRDGIAIPGAMQRFVEPNQAETFYSYDSLGRLLDVYLPGDAIGIPSAKYRYVAFYDPNDPDNPANPNGPGIQQVWVRNRSGDSADGDFASTHLLDGFGRIVQSVTELPATNEGMVSTRQYDLLGRLWRSSTPERLTLSGISFLPPTGSPRWSSTNYDILGRVTQETQIDGKIRTYEYPDLTVKTAFEGARKELEYDSYGRLWKVTEFDANEPHQTEYEYSVLDSLISITPAGTTATHYEYDSLNRRRRMQHPDRGDWSFSYDGTGHIVEQVDGNGRSLTFDYDELGRLIQKHSGAELIAQYFYDGMRPTNGDAGIAGQAALLDWGNEASEERFCETRVLHDTEIVDPADIDVCRIIMGPALHVASVDDVDLSAQSIKVKSGVRFTVDAGNPVRFAIQPPPAPGDPNAPDWASGFTVQGEPQRDPQDSSWIFDNENEEWRIDHELSGNLDERLVFAVTFQEDPNEPATFSLRLCCNEAGGDLVSSGNLWTRTGHVLTRRIEFDLSASEYATATKASLVVDDGWLRVLHTSLTRDADASSTALYTNAPETPSNAFFDVENGVGRMTAFLDATGQTAFSFDVRGRLVADRKAVDGLGYITSRSYKPDGLLESLVYPNGEAVQSSYDAARRLVGLESDRASLNHPTGPIPIVHDATYGPFGQLQTVAYGPGSGQDGQFHTTHSYHSEDLRLAQILTHVSGVTTPIQNLGYTYDARGNVSQVTDSPSSMTAGHAALSSIQYDTLDRLTSATLTGGVHSYGYDELGNLLTTEGRQHIYDPAKPRQVSEVLVPAFGPEPEKRNELDYDGNGNLTASTTSELIGGGWQETDTVSMAYDAENRLQHVTQGALSLDMSYDAQGTRVKRVLTTPEDGQEKTLYIGPHYEKRPDPDGATSLYHGLGRLVAERPFGSAPTGPGDEIRYFFADHLGSSSGVMNDSLQLELAQTYSPYGFDYFSTPSASDPNHPTTGYKFTGQEQDLAWLYNYKARSYLPGVGAFGQPDPIDWTPERLQDPQQLNPYAYARGNPIKYVDPNGARIVVTDHLYGDQRFQRAMNRVLGTSSGFALYHLANTASTAAGVDIVMTKHDQLSSVTSASISGERVSSVEIAFGAIDTAPTDSERYPVTSALQQSDDIEVASVSHELVHAIVSLGQSTFADILANKAFNSEMDQARSDHRQRVRDGVDPKGSAAILGTAVSAIKQRHNFSLMDAIDVLDEVFADINAGDVARQYQAQKRSRNEQ